MARLLVVEDDDLIGTLVRDQLRLHGYEVERACGVGEARQLLEGGVDLAVVDLGLPDGDGLDLVRELRRVDPATVVVVLTARDTEVDVIVALDAGADDYLVKPVRVAELAARVSAHLRRSHRRQEDLAQVEVGDLTVDTSARRAFLGGAELSLRAREFDLLACLARAAGTAVRRDDLMAQVWDENWFGSTKTLDVHVSSLRRRLAEAAGGQSAVPVITALRGVGYRMEA